MVGWFVIKGRPTRFCFAEERSHRLFRAYCSGDALPYVGVRISVGDVCDGNLGKIFPAAGRGLNYLATQNLKKISALRAVLDYDN